MKHQADNVRSLVHQYGAVPARIAPVEGEECALDRMPFGQVIQQHERSIEADRQGVPGSGCFR
jgi:hypothetical protein